MVLRGLYQVRPSSALVFYLLTHFGFMLLDLVRGTLIAPYSHVCLRMAPVI